MEGGASEFRELNSTVTRRGSQPEAAGKWGPVVDEQGCASQEFEAEVMR